MKTPPLPRAMCRRAVSVLETAMALAILAGVMVLTAKVLSVVARQQISSSQLLAAQFEAANVLERISLLPDAQFNQDGLGKMELSAEASSMLPEATLGIVLGEPVNSDEGGATEEANEAETPAMRSVRVEITWSPGPDMERSVTLTGWR